MKAKASKRYVGMFLLPAEIAKLEALMVLFQRRTKTDMLRFLINNGEKILSANATSVAKSL